MAVNIGLHRVLCNDQVIFEDLHNLFALHEGAFHLNYSSRTLLRALHDWWCTTIHIPQKESSVWMCDMTYYTNTLPSATIFSTVSVGNSQNTVNMFPSTC